MRTPSFVPFLGALALLAAACGEDRPLTTPAVPSNAASIDRLNSLRRGELSAIETYNQAIAKEGAQATLLATIRSDHEDAALKLSDRITALGGTPSATSGAWGDFTTAIEGAAKVFGNEAAMRSLKAGEKHGTDEYEEALADPSLDTGSKDLVRVTLLPRQRTHVDRLDELIKAQ